MRFSSYLFISVVLLLSMGCNSSKDASNPKTTDIPGKVIVLLDRNDPKSLLPHIQRKRQWQIHINLI